MTEAAVPGARGRGLIRLCLAETLLFLREPAAMFFSMAFPLVMLLFLGVTYKGTDDTGVRFIDGFVPQIVAVIAINIGMLGVAINIAECRAKGILRRYQLAPAPFWWFWLSQVYVGVLMFIVATAGLLVIVGLTYGLVMAAPFQFLLVALIGLGSNFAVGVLLGGLRMPVQTVQITGTALFFLLFFGSGAALPRSTFPEWLQAITSVNPMTPIVEASTSAYLGRDLAPHLLPLGLVLLFGVAVLAIARRVTTWEVDR